LEEVVAGLHNRSADRTAAAPLAEVERQAERTLVQGLDSEK